MDVRTLMKIAMTLPCHTLMLEGHKPGQYLVHAVADHVLFSLLSG